MNTQSEVNPAFNDINDTVFVKNVLLYTRRLNSFKCVLMPFVYDDLVVICQYKEYLIYWLRDIKNLLYRHNVHHWHSITIT